MAPRSKDRKLIIPVINFELVQPICSAYINVTDRRTDRQTDGRQYVHRAVKTVVTAPALLILTINDLHGGHI